MKIFLMAAMAVSLLAAPAWAEDTAESARAAVGQPAPDFTATDTNGTEVKLSDLKGKIVVLEWTNHECPYVQKHYGTGNMQKLQTEAAKDGIVWMSIVSSAAGKEGYTTPEEANSIMAEQDAHPLHKILDPDGTIGKLYDAKTTPDMYVIDQNGILAYSGAIDDNKSFKPETVDGAKNYVVEALTALKNGKPVEISETQPYGCGVKY